MKQDNAGKYLLTLTKDRPGLYSQAGATQVTDTTAALTHVGVYALDGSLNVTILLDELTHVTTYAQNGSLNVVDGALGGAYSPCGALNVQFI